MQYRHIWLLSVVLAFSLLASGFGHSAITTSPNGFIIDGSPKILRGGSVQWFRLPQETWRDRLTKFKAAGFNTVGMYIAWNQIEPEPGVFNFERPNIRHFLDLAQELGLYVAVRPGPYITNEMDGGGLPAWLTKDATKRDFKNDGKVHLRSHDPDFIKPVRRYFTALNHVLRPYLKTNGGPIVLYAIENEYTWFERAFKLDKLFRHEGQWERPLRQALPTRPYFQALYDITQETGIDVPIVSCPGDGRASAMGNVKGVVPFPSMYEWANPDQPDQMAYNLISQMHDPLNHDGAYLDVPGGSLEINRSPTEFRRLIMGGLDGLFGFNMAGIIQEGYLNSLTLAARAFDVPPHFGPPEETAAPWLPTIFKFDRIDRVVTGFVSPNLGYVNNVLDYGGAISSSGLLRESFYQFRRDNMTYDLLEPFLAQMERPNRSGRLPGANPRLTIHQDQLGSRESTGMVHYWYEDQDFKLIQVVNQSGQDQVIPVGAVSLDGETYPRYKPFSIPNAREPKLTYAHNLAFRLPLSQQFTLNHSTSEVLTSRSFHNETLLVVYGADGTPGEIAISGPRQLQLLYQDDGIQREEEHQDDLVALSYRHGALRQIVLSDAKGHRLRILITNRQKAGRFWFTNQEGQDIIVIGPDFVEPQGSHVRYSYSRQRHPLIVMSGGPLKVEGHQVLQAFRPETKLQTLAYRDQAPLPNLPIIKEGVGMDDHAEVSPEFDDQSWQRWTGEPKNLEDLGIYQGHAFYRTSFDLKHNLNPLLNQLYVESASDMVGIYVNGQYITTLNPIGTEINNWSINRRYRFAGLGPYLKKGRNTLAFRTEIWGHGSFMFGRGTVALTMARIPALGYDGLKGLHGAARIGDIPLTDWAVRKDLGGEIKGYGTAEYQDEHWQPEQVPLKLKKGAIRWYRTRFQTTDLGNPDIISAPIVLQIKGQNTKGTIFVNGRLLGRWLSDDAWLNRGTWVTAQRSMWSSLKDDHYPIPRELLKGEGQDNVIAIAFEDASHHDQGPGEIYDLSLQYNEEQFIWQDGSLKRTIGIANWAPLYLQYEAQSKSSQP